MIRALAAFHFTIGCLGPNRAVIDDQVKVGKIVVGQVTLSRGTTLKISLRTLNHAIQLLHLMPEIGTGRRRARAAAGDVTLIWTPAEGTRILLPADYNRKRDEDGLRFADTRSTRWE